MRRVECEFTSAGDQYGERISQDVLKLKARYKPLVMLETTILRKDTIVQSIELENDQQAALWMDCVEEKSCELLKTSGGRFCAPIW